MKLAAIDIGTNSTRLLIADALLNFKDRLQLVPIEREMQITRLGKNLQRKKIISDKAAEDTLKVLRDYYDLIKKNDVVRYRAVGTKALRQASNAEWFKSYVRKSIGLELEIIDWKEEARLSFIGAIMEEKVQSYCRLEDKDIMVIDIGGGSTEFVIGNKSADILYTESADIGSVILTEKFFKHDIPIKIELDGLKTFIREKIKNIVRDISNNSKGSDFLYLIGVAGTITTLASIELELENYDRERIHGHILKLDSVIRIYHRLISLNLSERKKVKGLEPKRADIIIAGTAVLIEIMSSFGIEELFVSESDILDGIVYSIF